MQNKSHPKSIIARPRARQIAVLFVVALAALCSGVILRSLAQSAEGPWTQPVNVTNSGAATQPTIAAVPDGTLHLLWWDAVEGTQYAWTTSLTQTIWSKSVGVPFIWGDRRIMTNTETGKVTISLSAPREIRLAADARGNVAAFWYDVNDQLLNAQLRGNSWGGATTLSEAALSMDVAADVSGTLRLAYIRSVNSPEAPAGVYYRATTNGGVTWSTPILVYASSYFRTSKPEQAHVSVTGDGLGRTLVAWDDPHLQKSFYARSADGGRTWGDPQTVSGGQFDQALQAQVTSTPSGEFLLITQDISAGGCGLSQRRSTDGGQTWSAPERILSSLAQCAGRWSFVVGGDAQLWLMGIARSDAQSAKSTSSTLAAWDGKTWSEPSEVSISFRDPETSKEVSLACLSTALAGKSIGVVGCDSNGDVWAARNAVALENLLPALKPVWSPLVRLSDSGTRAGLPALASDQSKVYALWSQGTENDLGMALYASVWENNRWSPASQVLRSPEVPTGIPAAGQAASKAEQPSLAADSQGRLHAVWSGGLNGEIYYSWTYARDVTSASAWTAPVALPTPAQMGSWPQIVADPRGEVLHVIYALPYNEGRGIYYVRSNNAGATWQAPVVVFSAVAAGWDSADKPRLALDARANVLHAVWLRAQLPGGAGTQAVVYSRSTDGGQTWNAPVNVTEGWVDSPQVAATGSTGQVYLVWNQARKQGDDTSAEVWGQFSTDGGEHWTEPKRIIGFEEVNGPVSFASDGAGGLYLVGVGRGAEGESALFYGRWDGQAWAKRESLGLGQDAVPGNAASAVLAPDANWLAVAVRAWAIEQNNVGRFKVLATGREVAVLPVTPAPTFTPLPTLTPPPTATPRPTATAKPQLTMAGPARTTNSDPLQGQLPLIMGGALAVVVVLTVVIGRIIWTARR